MGHSVSRIYIRDQSSHNLICKTGMYSGVEDKCLMLDNLPS